MNGHPLILMLRYTWLQAWRTRWFWLAAISMCIAVGIGLFFRSLAITETTATFVSIATAVARLLSVGVLIFFIIASVMRDRHERALEWLLALPLSRRHYYLGRWFGFVALAGVLTALWAPWLWMTVPPLAAVMWLTAFWCELVMVGSFALLCAVSLNQLPAAITATLGFYALARSADAMLAMATHPVLPDASEISSVVTSLIQVITWLLPDLSSYTHSSILLYPSEITSMSPMLIQTLIYVVLLLSIGLIDFHRRELT